MDKLKTYKQAPLPFIGQKRRCGREIAEVVKDLDDDYIVIDLFGGSGLVAHTIKRARPDLRVIWNDYDDFFGRCAKIEQTNEVRRRLAELCTGVPVQTRLSDELRDKVQAYLRTLPDDSDWITIKSQVSFNAPSEVSPIEANQLFQNIRVSDYKIGDFFVGLERVSMDYTELLDLYKGQKVFVVADPPYMMTAGGQVHYSRFGGMLWTFDLLYRLRDFPHALFASPHANISEFHKYAIKLSDLDYKNDTKIIMKDGAPVVGGKRAYAELMFVKTKFPAKDFSATNGSF